MKSETLSLLGLDEQFAGRVSEALLSNAAEEGGPFGIRFKLKGSRRLSGPFVPAPWKSAYAE